MNELTAGERLYVTDEAQLIGHDHAERYQWARKYIGPTDAVLDASCGTGYGSSILADVAKEVIGVDVSSHGIAWAKNKYHKPNLSFRKGDLNKKLDLPSESIDVVVSFETIEHLTDQETMLSEFKRILKPNGTFLISSPNREIITDKAKTYNPFHINELTHDECLRLVARYFTIREELAQSRYVEPSLFKKAVKLLAKVDFLDLHRPLLRAIGMTGTAHLALSPIEYAGIEKPSGHEYFVTILVCQK